MRGRPRLPTQVYAICPEQILLDVPPCAHYLVPMSPLAIRRSLLDLTQQQLAEAARISVRYVQVLESGKSVPSVRIAQRICAVLGCRIEDLWPAR